MPGLLLSEFVCVSGVEEFSSGSSAGVEARNHVLP